VNTETLPPLAPPKIGGELKTPLLTKEGLGVVGFRLVIFRIKGINHGKTNRIHGI
jgi:hypothetical protein